MPFEINTVLKESDFNYKKAFPRFPPGDLLTGGIEKMHTLPFFDLLFSKGRETTPAYVTKTLVWASSSDEYRRVHIRQCLEDVFRH